MDNNRWRSSIMDMLAIGDAGARFLQIYNSNMVELYSRITGASVKEYGAVGDGLSDDTKAIQDAIDDVQDGNLILPVGRYLVSSLNITRSLRLIGEGISFNGVGGTCLISTMAQPIINIIKPLDAIPYCGAILSNFSIIGNKIGDGSDKQTGVLIDKEGMTIINNIGIYDCGDYAVRLSKDNNVSGVVIKNSMIAGNSKGGIYSRCGDTIKQVNAIYILESNISSNLGYGINLSGNNYVVRNNIIQNNYDAGILISNNDLPLVTGGSKAVTISENYFEFNKGGDIIIEAELLNDIVHFHDGINISSNYFNIDLNYVTREGIVSSITLNALINQVKHLNILNNNIFRLRNNATKFSGNDALDETCNVEV